MFDWQKFLMALSLDLSDYGWVSTLAIAVWGWLIDLLNSNFSTALLGAFAGAYGGQYIVERSKSREALLSEIRNTNNAIILVYDICNRCISLKRQHVKDLKEKYEAEHARLNAFRMAAQHGQIKHGTVYEFIADLRTLPPIETPIELLQTQLFEKTSPGPQALTLVSVLKQCLIALKDITERRNTFIEKHKTDLSSGTVLSISPDQYFGLPDPNGHIDASIPSFIDGIYTLTDDTIFFSSRLSISLVAHCEVLTKKFGKRAPKVVRPDFSKAEKLGLMPNSKEYVDWEYTGPTIQPVSAKPLWRNRLNFFKNRF